MANARHQAIVDRFVPASRSPRAICAPCARHHGWAFDMPIYEQFFRTVRGSIAPAAGPTAAGAW